MEGIGGEGPPARLKVWTFPFCWILPPVPLLSLIIDHILEKMVSPIFFRQTLPGFLRAAYIFSNTILTNLKKLISNKSFNTKQCPAGLSPRIIFLNLYRKPRGWGKIPDNIFLHLIFPTRKMLLNKITSFTIKSVIPSQSNSSFHLITLYKLHL